MWAAAIWPSTAVCYWKLFAIKYFAIIINDVLNMWRLAVIDWLISVMN